MASAREELRRALEAFSRGNLDEAGRLCEAALAADGRDAAALHLSAAIALSQGRPGLALERVDAAIQANRRDARQYQTRGQAHVALGNLDAAESDFRRALEITPDFPDAHASLGARLLERGHPLQARSHLERALEKRPAATPWRYNLALCESRLGRKDVAERHLAAVLQASPQWPPALNECGVLLLARGDHEASRRMLEAAVRIEPRFAEAWNHLGLVHLAQGDVAGAQAAFERCLSIDPANADALTNLGNAKRRAGDRAAAEDAYRRALDHRPDAIDALKNLGNILRERGRYEESKSVLERVVAATGNPDAHFGLGLTLLTMGQLERGWDEYRWRDDATPDAQAKAWLSKALSEGRPIELVGEQGLGDVIFFLRWIAGLAADPARVSLRCDPRLYPLLRGAGLVGRYLDPDAPAEAALSLRLGDLPALLGSGDAAYPSSIVLEPDPAALEAARAALRSAGPSPYVAIAWRAGLPSSADQEHLFKEVPLDLLGGALASAPGTIVSVQRDPRPGEHDTLSRRLGRPVLDASAFNDDLPRIAGMMAAVDSYAGVSSTNVHLRAAFGRDADILVPLPPEWRYGAEGSATPWYPRFRLHREHSQRGWSDAMASLAAAYAGARA